MMPIHSHVKLRWLAGSGILIVNRYFNSERNHDKENIIVFARRPGIDLVGMCVC